MPGAYAAEFFIFLNTGPLNAAIVNSVAAPIRSTAISVNLLTIHLLGDAFSPGLIGRISDATNLRIGLGSTLFALAASGIILFAGARFAPRLPDLEPGSAPRFSLDPMHWPFLIATTLSSLIFAVWTERAVGAQRHLPRIPSLLDPRYDPAASTLHPRAAAAGHRHRPRPQRSCRHRGHTAFAAGPDPPARNPRRR